MFDLPVRKKKERKYAANFRKTLLDHGFYMAQYSVYCKLLDGKEAIESMEHKIVSTPPSKGSIHILTITDKQYEQIRVFENHEKKTPEKTEQLILF